MLIRVLAQLNNDEQRWQCLQTLRSKLSRYKLNEIDATRIVELFQSFDEQQRSTIFDYLLSNSRTTSATLHSIEFVEIHQNLLPTFSTIDDENFSVTISFPSRTSSFLIAIKETFERLKETSSWFEHRLTSAHDEWWSKSWAANSRRHSA